MSILAVEGHTHLDQLIDPIGRFVRQHLDRLGDTEPTPRYDRVLVVIRRRVLLVGDSSHSPLSVVGVALLDGTSSDESYRPMLRQKVSTVEPC